MADRIQLRRDTAANWTNYNPILLEGEPGIELDTDQWKLGDGIHNWNDLPYRGGPYVQQRGQSTTAAMSQKAVTDELNLIAVFDISAYNLTDGQPTKYADLAAALGTNGANVPESYRRGGMTVKYVQSSDNKYVQYRCKSSFFTTNTEDWTFDNDGILVSNPEFITVEIDKVNKLFASRKTDGTKVEYGDFEVKGSIINNELNSKISSKVNKEESKSLIDSTFSDNINSIENPEFLDVGIDNEKKVIHGRDKNGILHENVGIETPLLITGGIDFSGQGLQKLEQDLIDDGFNPGGGDDVVKSVSVAGVAIPKNLNDVPLPIASTAQYGLMSPQDKTKLGTIQPTINITGSGVTKNAASFGFLPTATAADNNTAITSALDGGGTILVDVPGIYDISVPIVIPSNTTLIFGANTFVRMQADMYAVINAGAYTRVYDENIKLIGLHLMANGYKPPVYNITEGASNNGVIYGLCGFVNFFYVKHLGAPGFFRG